MAFSQAELEAAARRGDIRSLFQREIDSGFMKPKSLPASYIFRNGKVEPKPDTWLEKYGWLLAAGPMAAGLLLPAAGAAAATSGATAVGTTSGAAGIAGNMAAAGAPAIWPGASAAASAAAAGGGSAAAAAAGGGMNWGNVWNIGSDLFGDLFSTWKQSQAADRSADITSAAANRAAELQAKAQADALAFQYATAQNAFDNNEVGRHTNYDWSAARDRRLGFIGDEVGLPARETPAFRPGVDPRFGGGWSGGGGGQMYPSRPENMPKPGEVDWTAPADKLRSQLTAFYKSRGVADSEVPYWIREAGNLVARGRELGDPNYANMRLAASDIFGGGAGAPAPAGGGAPATSRPSSASTVVPYLSTVRPTALRFPGVLGDYA